MSSSSGASDRKMPSVNETLKPQYFGSILHGDVWRRKEVRGRDNWFERGRSLHYGCRGIHYDFVILKIDHNDVSSWGNDIHCTVGPVLNAWFNNCVLCFFAYIANLMIARVDAAVYGV